MFSAVQPDLHRFWGSSKSSSRRSFSELTPVAPAETTFDRDILAAGSSPTAAHLPASVESGGVDLTEPPLSAEQKSLVDLIRNGRSVFYTGSAGTGKSYVLRVIISVVKARYINDHGAVAVTASTGIAACNIGGVTLHSFAGIGLASQPVEDLVERVRWNAAALARWRKVVVLVVDEVSMIDAALFHKLECVARVIRDSTEPFGGIQLIATGDFLQLPPVTQNGPPGFAFECPAWRAVFRSVVLLRTVYRQSDEDFVSMLNGIRVGRVPIATVDTLVSLKRPLLFSSGPEPTKLFSRRSEVDADNSRRLQKLSSPLRVFEAVDGGKISDRFRRARLLTNVSVPKTLRLCVGAQVMLAKNIDADLVNGSVGTVLGFVYANVGQVDGRYAVIDETVPARDNQVAFPLVCFHLLHGKTRDAVVRPELFTVQTPSGEVQVSRLQLPLILAWAISIHKAQGQSLERVIVDLKHVFERGQVYVALSRAITMDGLQVLNFSPDKVQVHPKVVAWYRDMDEHEG